MLLPLAVFYCSKAAIAGQYDSDSALFFQLREYLFPEADGIHDSGNQMVFVAYFIFGQDISFFAEKSIRDANYLSIYGHNIT